MSTSRLFQVVAETMNLNGAKMPRDDMGAVASHGRHPNFSFLMGAPRNRNDRTSSVPIHHETPSIAERPYIYWFTGRKWPSSLHQKALCEAASCEIAAPPQPCPSSCSFTLPAAVAAQRLRCTRYEIVGSPVVLERFQFPNNENSLCRMFCSKQLPQEARAGSAVAHLDGANVEFIRLLFLEETAPILLPEHGHREASWSTFNSALDDERSSESSCSGVTTTSTARTALSKGGRGSSEIEMLDAPSLGRSSTSSYGMSSSATPLTPPSTRGDSATPSTAGHSPEPVLLAPSAADTSVPAQCHYKTATTRTFHLSTVADIVARDGLLYCHNFSKEHQTAEATLSYQTNSFAVLQGWTYWRNNSADLATLERRSVVSSMHEIMMSNSCSRTAYHLAVSLLDRYVATSATVLAASSSSSSLLIDTPSSNSIRIAIACAISVAAKAVDIYAPSLERLGMSLGAGVFTSEVPFEKRELNFLYLLRFYVHPLTVEEVSDTLLELWFGCSTQIHPSVGTPTPAMNTSSKRAAAMTRYMVDFLVRSATHTSIPPTYVAAAVVQYSVEAVRAADKLSEKDLAPLDEEGLHVFMSYLTDQDLANQCIDLLRRLHSVARQRPVEFLENHYNARQSSRSCRTAFLEPFSIQSVPLFSSGTTTEAAAAYHR